MGRRRWDCEEDTPAIVLHPRRSGMSPGDPAEEKRVQSLEVVLARSTDPVLPILHLEGRQVNGKHPRLYPLQILQ